MKKRISILVTVAIAMISNMSMVTVATTTMPHQHNEVSSQSIDSRADVIVNKYREYKGMLQRRRWNETRGYWVDDEWTTISIHSLLLQLEASSQNY